MRQIREHVFVAPLFKINAEAVLCQAYLGYGYRAPE
jgi:hypothetical protein